MKLRTLSQARSEYDASLGKLHSSARIAWIGMALIVVFIVVCLGTIYSGGVTALAVQSRPYLIMAFYTFIVILAVSSTLLYRISGRRIRLFCAQCKKFISEKPWICGVCNRKNATLSPLYQCEHCCERPPGFFCPHCQEGIFIGSDEESSSHWAFMADSTPQRKPVVVPRDPEIVEWERCRDQIKRRIQQNLLEAKEAETAGLRRLALERAYPSPKQTPIEQSEDELIIEELQKEDRVEEKVRGFIAARKREKLAAGDPPDEVRGWESTLATRASQLRNEARRNRK
jgi:hypothetical protein